MKRTDGRFQYQSLKQIYDMSDQTEGQTATEKLISKDRVYFSMLERVGTKGRYQYLLMFFIFLIGMESSACFLVNPYLFYQQPFECPQEISNCKQFVCDLPIDKRSAYIPAPDGKKSLATEFGDRRCQGQEFVLLLNSSIILGSVIGIFSAIFFTEWLGRRWTMVLSLGLAIIGLLICLIPSETVVVIGVFLYGAGLDISYSCVFTLVTEFFAEKDRGYFYNIIGLSFATGIFINPVFFYLIDSWKPIVLTAFILPILVAALGFIFYVQDTPIELIAYKKPQYILAAFQRIAKLNRKPNHGLTLEGVRQVKQQYDENQRKKHARVFSILDIFRFKSLRAHIIPLGALKFMMMFIYYAPGLLLDQFAMNIYVNGFVNALSQLCGIPFQLWLLKFPRKRVTYILFVASAVFSVGMFVSSELCSDCAPGHTTFAQGLFLFLYRICCTVVSFIVVVMLNETYPAQVRNLAIFINISFGRSATLLVPFVSGFCDVSHIPFLILLACCSMIGAGVTCFAQETFGIAPPEMIKEVQIQQHHYKHFSIQDAQDPKELIINNEDEE